MIDKAYVLTDEERAARNSVQTPEHERMRLYGRDLRATSQAYAVAADAPGLRKDAARFLFQESLRLDREGMAALERADAMETQDRIREEVRASLLAQIQAQIPAADRWMAAVYGGRLMFHYPLGSVKTAQAAREADRLTVRIARLTGTPLV